MKPVFAGDQLLFIGQDLQSIKGYMEHCRGCPIPDGFVTYLSLGYLTSSDFYGGLGYTKKRRCYQRNVDWGAGPLNAYRLVQQYDASHCQIGLYMVGQTRKVIEGRLNRELKHLSRYFHEFPSTTFYLRIGYEFDGRWNGYDPIEYIQAYRYIVDYLRDRGVQNVQYVWHASASPIDDLMDGYKEDVMHYYPGDDYVDWLAISWFLTPNAGPDESSQLTLADEVVDIARSKSKPLMIAEASNQGYNNSELTKGNITSMLDGSPGKGLVNKTAEQIWSEWYAPFFDWIERNSDVVRGISYINANWDIQKMWTTPYQNGYWGDSRIEVNVELQLLWIEAFSHHQGR